MKKLFYICNLHSGKAKTAAKLAMIVDHFTKYGYDVTVHPTQEKLDASNSAEYACNNGYDLIVCSGGDGTLNEVIQGLMKSEKKIPIGYLPSGSTNDFARSMTIPTNLEKAVEYIANGTPKSCDIGSLNNRHFTYIAAFGAFTKVPYNTSQSAKNILGYVAYILNGMSYLNKIESYHMKISYDDKVIEDDFVFGMVTNSSSVAGVLSLNDFQYDDGIYEVTLIKTPKDLKELHRIIHSLINFNTKLDERYISYFRTSKIKFECSKAISWTVDGEFGGSYKISEVENINKAVEIIVHDDNGKSKR